MQIIGQLMTTRTGHLSRLLEHCHAIQQVEQVLWRSLPTVVSEHCHVANLRERTIVIDTDSPAWANRLRYLVPDLLKHWQQNSQLNLPIIDTIEVRTRPLTVTTPAPISHKPPIVLSAQTIELLHKTADTLSYPPLKIAMRRLANRSTG